MRISSNHLFFGLTAVAVVGCTIPGRSLAPGFRPTAQAAPTSLVVPAAYQIANGNAAEAIPPPMKIESDSSAPPHELGAPALGLPELIGLTLQRNPSLARVGWAVDTARGKAVQAGIYPNSTFNVSGNELADRTGSAGIWSAYTSQEIVTANKLGLSQSAAEKEVDQANLNLIAERYRVFTEVRQSYYEALTLQQRAEILAGLVRLAEQSVGNSNKLLRAKEAAELDVVQLEVDLERYRADLEATLRALPASYRKVAASVGVQDMPLGHLAGNLDTPLPDYDLERVRMYVLGIHPEIRAAEVGVERAQFVLRRAEVEPIPNVTVGAGYTYQGQNRSNDWDLGVGVPIPLWDRNQGNIRAAQAQVSEAVSQVGRVQNDVVNRLATAFANYASARQRAERYRSAILPRAQRTYDLSLRAYQGGQFEYLRVLEAQRAVAEAQLELVRSLGEMWQAASEIAGLMLEDQWPLVPAAPLPRGNNA